MSTPKVSVIVPIYNVEKFIDKCLNTIQQQSFRDFEVLLINDETPDNSMEIAKKYADSDPRFRILNKKNGGLSDARNFGLRHAEGEFVVFIDSDDYIHRDYLDVLYHECADNGADMSCCRFMYSFFNIGLKLPWPVNAAKEVMKTRDALNILIRDNYLQSYAWNKMYRRTLFTENHIEYPTMYFEDIATSGRVLYHSNKLAISDRFLYYYVQRHGSIMATMDARKINDYMRSVLIVRNHIQMMGLYEDYKKSIYHFGMKMRIVNLYSILRQHILHLDFRKLGYNFRMNKNAFLYITSDDYKAEGEFPDIPYKIHQPGWRVNRKK